jgi:hypothetical protein
MRELRFCVETRPQMAEKIHRVNKKRRVVSNEKFRKKSRKSIWRFAFCTYEKIYSNTFSCRLFQIQKIKKNN